MLLTDETGDHGQSEYNSRNVVLVNALCGTFQDGQSYCHFFQSCFTFGFVSVHSDANWIDSGSV